MIGQVVLWLAVVAQATALSTRATGACSTKADVTFVLDSSDSVGQNNFNSQLNFMKDVVNKLDVGGDRVHIGALTFSSGVHSQFFLNNHVNKNDVLSAIGGIQYIPGNTDTADALKFLYQQSYGATHGARGDAPHIAVLLTDGPSITKDITKLQAQTAKDNNVIIYSIGVGSGIDADELQSISSDPDSRYYMHADNYGTLSSLSDLLATKICNELPPNPALLPQPTGTCLQQADVVFMVDSSASIGNEDFQRTQIALKNVISNMNVSPNGVHVGVMQYSSYPTMGFPLSMYMNRGDALHAVERLKMMGGGTNTADAIKYTTDEMFAQSSGARPNVPRVAILLTNGGSLDSQAAVTQAEIARQAGIGLNVVGIGSNLNMQEINSIANQPSGSHVITVNSYNDLQSVANNIIQQACAVRNTYSFAQQSCADALSNCLEYGRSVCTNYKAWSQKNCKLTCGFCPYQYSVNKQCADKLNNCVQYGSDVCTQNKAWAQDNCKLYCGFCGSTTSASGFYGQCAYKGKMYQTGAKWDDGCDYECVCKDGSKGNYQCYNKCPLYYNLPSMCTLVRTPGECCLKPVCNFNTNVQKFESNAKGTTASGIPVCQYKGKQYFEGQTWQDGCDYQCSCTDASQGRYRCEQRCPTYSKVLPAGCHMQKNPGACCAKPVCEFDQQQGSFSGSGSISSGGVASNIIPPSPCEDKRSNCASYGKSMCTSYPQWAGDNCRKYCSICQDTLQNPGPNDRCIYNGVSYAQGVSWDSSCDRKCTCENAKYGYYRCVDSCPRYNNLPQGCQERAVSRGDCCPRVFCQTGAFYSSSPNINSLGNGGFISVLNPSQPLSPNPPGYQVNQAGAGSTGFTAPKLNGCLYNGNLYVQGQMWDDGCKLSCTCEDAASGRYKCRAKCPQYQNLASTCVMVTDTNEPCCMKPKCGFDVATGQIPVPVPSYGAAQTALGVVQPVYPTSSPQNHFTGMWVILNNTAGMPKPPTFPPNGNRNGYCNYKGTTYQAGQSWKDGCDYNCICDDGPSGHYTCIEICRKFSYVPQPYCRLTQDPQNPCCKVPECRFQPDNVQFTGQVPNPTQGTGNVCVYNEKQYQQGQSWYDGCSYRCTCENAERGIYRCTSRCPEILDAMPGCTYITDPRDPTCCRVPDCRPPNATSGPNPSPNPIPPKIYQGQTVNSPGKCVYLGKEYGTGEIWQDGCDYTCECTDALKGHYECTDRCPQYTGLPDNCEMVNDFANPCCKKPKCYLSGIPGSFSSVSPNPLLPSPLPQKQQFCIYKGAQYLQGQVWEDGCSYKCRCDDNSRGIYTCNERCQSIKDVKAGCKLISDPEDSCCLVEVCYGSTSVPGQPTPVPTIVPVPITGKVNLPTPSPKPGEPLPTPKFPLGYCVYKGRTYTQGQTWDDGCDYTCECYDADHGKYRCQAKCPRYVNIPSNCRLSKDPSNPCCQIVECSQNTPPPTPSHTNVYTGSGTPPPNPNPSFQPQPVTTPAPVPKNVCEYKGVTYVQGQQWYDGCDFTCICEDGMTGVYRCSSRCPDYDSIPAGCTMEADPRDPLCCKVPKCPNSNTAPPQVVTGGIITPPPTQRTTPAPQPYPSSQTNVFTGTRTTPPPQTPPILIPGQTYPSGTPYIGGTYPPGTVPTRPPVRYTPYPGGTYPPNYSPNPSSIPTFQPYQTYNPYITPYPSGTYPPGQTYPGPTPYPHGTYPPGYTPLPTTPAPVNPVVIYLTQAPIGPGGTYPPFKTPYVGGTYPTGTVPVTPFIGGTYPPNYTPGPYQTFPSFEPGKTYPTNRTPYPSGTYPTGTVPPRTPYPGGTYPPNYSPVNPPTPKPVRPIFIGGNTYPTDQTPYPGQTYPTGTVPYQYTPYIGGTYPPGFTFIGGKPPVSVVPGQTYPTNKTPYPGGTYPPRVTVPPLTPFIGGTYPPYNTPPPNYRPSSFIPGGTYPKYSTPYPGGTYPTGTVPMGTPYPGGSYPPGFTFSQPQTPAPTPNRIIPGATYPPNLTPYPSGTYPPGLTAPPATPFVGGTYPSGYTPFFVVTNTRPPNGGTVYPPNATPYLGGTFPPLTYAPYTPYPGGTYPPTTRVPYNPNPVTSFFTNNSPFVPYQTYPPNRTPYPNGTYPPGTVPPPRPYPSGTYPPGFTNPPNPATYIPGQTYPPYATPYPSGTYPPGLTVPYTPYPDGTYPPQYTLAPGPTNPPTPATQAPIVKPNMCVYKGKNYATGQRWQDGCDYDCICENGMTGVYKCTEKCPRYTNLQPGCQLIQDYNKPCCKKPYCPPTATPPTTTPVPLRTDGKPAVCTYNGVTFKQGETWNDGCDLVCICEDGMTGFYRCNDRCPQYQLTAGCTLESDPSDPCCKRPVCHPEQLTPPTYAPTPSVNPGETPMPTTAAPPYTIPLPTAISYGSGPNGGRGCMYKGVAHDAGQTWQDGCLYNCECLDMKTGRYRCSQRCPSFDGIVPPPNCQLVTNPNDKCCKMMQCVRPTPSPAPTTPRPYQPVYTTGPNPQPGTTRPPLPTTPVPVSRITQPPNVCIMNGKQYTQGQSWYDGCQQKCVCEDGRTGYYRCSQRCNAYPNLPADCTLIPDPNDPQCCQVPQCATQQPSPGQPITLRPPVAGVVTGSGTLPPPTTPAPTPYNPFTTPVYTFTPPPSTVTPKPSPKAQVCVYNGISYATGQQWQDGCKYNCICEDGMTGRYKCTERCPQVARIPLGCTTKRDPKDYCCSVVYCEATTTPGPVHPGQPTPPPTQPTPFCVYNGVPYKQGQTWDDGCTQRCRCDDAMNNHYTCFDRCKQWPNLPAGCTKQTDPNDPCCQIPVCTTPAPQPQGPNASPTPYNPYPSALPPGEIIGKNPTTPNPFNPSPKHFCEYKGKQYTTGQTWEDGCDYRCECIDDMSGRYRCVERCPTFAVQPSCYLVQDDKDACCKKQYCPPPTTPAPITTPRNTPPTSPGETPRPTQPTPIPLFTQPKPEEVCVFMGRTYTQGQTFYDGCDRICVCDNGRTGHYTCQQRCRQYQNSPGCILVPEPSDPECCKRPQCTGTAQPYIDVTPAPTTPAKFVLTFGTGTIVSGGGTTPSTVPPRVCVYNNQVYKQGEKWQDGCKYTCECVDAVSGRYKCVERCTQLTNVPQTCTLKYNPQDPCCPVPDCPSIIAPTGPTPASYSPPPQPEFCVYNGVPYRQGQTWNVGCEKICRCDDAHTGQVNCDERCPSYGQLAPGCSLVTNPADQCCQAPICIDRNSTNPFTVISGGKGSFTGDRQPNPQNPFSPVNATKTCVYHGKVYHQGEKWDDGCLFQCQCIDEQSGRYRCTERCARTPSLPSYCTMVQDPNDQCCQRPYCPIQKPTSPKPGQPQGTYVPPTLDICVYNGQSYRQGQQWYDGCSKVCRCENATLGYFRCQERCTNYARVPSACTLVPDPNDPQCCKSLSCLVTPPPTPGTVKPLVPVYGSVTGYGPSSTPAPTIMVNGSPQPLYPGQTTPTPMCVYKGRSYTQGQSWDDGCQYHCECIDQSMGQYRCTEKCQRYPKVPDYCTLVKDPNNVCCPVLYCGNPANPNPTIPTQYKPYPYTTPSSLIVNPNPNANFSNQNPPQTQTTGYCVYKGVYYRQGQKWNDGCDKTCTCNDVNNNLYSCVARCPTFDRFPSNCRLVADINDPCCVVPQCNIMPTQQVYTGSGKPPATTPLPVVYATSIPGASFTGSNPNANPLYPNLQTGVKGKCVYGGKTYNQGETWKDGCQLSCSCLDAVRGYYKCDYQCPQYYNLPYYCHYETDPKNSCCKVARCDPNQTTPPTTPPSYVVTTPRPTYPTVTATIRPQDVCRYTDYTVHAQGSTWDDGCSYRCRCLDATTNNYRCDARCPVFNGLPDYCTMEQDPNDRCCKIPRCITSGINLNPYFNGMNGSATPAPNSFNALPVGNLNSFYGSGETKPNSANPYASGSGYGVCVYKGKSYKQGASWDDGCDYTCTCVNAQKGEYRCLSKCSRLPQNLPAYCRVTTIPGQCCKKLTCDVPGVDQSYKPPSEVTAPPVPTDAFGHYVTQSGGSITNAYIPYVATTQQTAFPGQGFPIAQSQFSNVRDQCIFNSKDGQYLVYNEGDKWKDGCDYTCECKDGSSGYYECLSACPVYNNLPSSRCYLVRVDGKCCSEPRCQLENGQVVNPLIQQTSYPIVPSQNGGYLAFRPDTNYQAYTNSSSFTGNRNQCIYKGTVYQPGASWSDGCDFNCRCEDGNNGQFTCTPRCPVYTKLPSFCTLDTMPGECCKKLNCVSKVVTTTPDPSITTKPPRKSCDWCRDTLDNCDSYDSKTACVAPYDRWAKRNCPNYCGMCDCDHPPTTTTAIPGCTNKLSNCEDYGKTSCTGIFASWAKDNCQAYCDLCKETTQSACHDEQPGLCQSLKDSVCTNVAYRDWSRQNCKQTCGLCSGSGVTQAPQSCQYSDGVTYSHGAYWVDGCNSNGKNCTCVDGQVSCLRLCPIYQNLQGWKLVNVQGQCCPKLVRVYTPQCHYINGQSYDEGQTWSDGCKLTCQCTDAKNGLYQCREKCPQWNLPSVCHWVDPQPGKCCRQPVCPPPFEISGYPDE